LTAYCSLWLKFQPRIYCPLWRRFQLRINCTLWLRYRPHIYCPLWYRPHTSMWWRFQSHCSRGISLIIIARGGGSIRLIFIYLPCIAGCGRSVSLIMNAALAKVSSASYCPLWQGFQPHAFALHVGGIGLISPLWGIGFNLITIAVLAEVSASY